MIYTGLGRLGEIADVKAHGGADVAEVYGGINEASPIYYKAITITGTSPLTFKGLGLPLKNYIISGNTLQDGTPTPEAPVGVQGVGVKTENLFDKSTITIGKYINSSGDEVASSGTGEQTLNHSDYIEINAETVYAFKCTKSIEQTSDSNAFCWFDSSKQLISRDVFNIGFGVAYTIITATAPTGAAYLIMNYRGLHGDTAMLNVGSTPLPYEPYGYKLPLTVNGAEYPIYLGQVPTRRIKKLVLTGEDNFGRQNVSSADPSFARFSKIFQFGSITSTTAILYASTHFIGSKSFGTSSSTAENCFEMRFSNGTTTIMIVTNAATDATSFNQWLSDQYAAGTPVIVWYVLATTETGIVNEPLMKIVDYADTISMTQAGVTIPTVAGTNTLTVDTTVQPSSVSITGNIKEVQGT